MKTYCYTEDKKTAGAAEQAPRKEDFSHIKGDIEDFIFSFADTKKHSEK